MNRRDFLKRMALAGLVLPSTRTIIDMGANLWREPAYYTGVFFHGGPSGYYFIARDGTTVPLRPTFRERQLMFEVLS